MKTKIALLACAAALAAPAFALAQAHPDFTGDWMVTPYTGALKPADGKPVPLTAEGKAAYAKHLSATAKGDKTWDESSICLPEGLPRIMTINEPFQIMQRDKTVFFVAQNRMPWKAFFGEPLPTDVDPFYMGYSVAKWTGPTLVIDSNGFRDSTVLDDKGLPHGEGLHLTQTFHMGKTGKTMTVSYTVTDPKFYTHPWTATVSFKKLPASFQMPEEVCAAKLETTAPKR
jgi:hypothetical protein